MEQDLSCGGALIGSPYQNGPGREVKPIEVSIAAASRQVGRLKHEADRQACLLNEVQELQVLMRGMIGLREVSSAGSARIHADHLLQGPGLGHVPVGPLQYVGSAAVLLVHHAGDVTRRRQSAQIGSVGYSFEKLNNVCESFNQSVTPQT